MPTKCRSPRVSKGLAPTLKVKPLRGSNRRAAARRPFHCRQRLALALALVVALVSASAAQTHVTVPPNKYSVEDDVKAGREAAAEVERQMPLLRDDAVESYVVGLGDRLVDGIPSE